MNTLRISFDVPEGIAKYVNFNDAGYKLEMQELMLYSLIKNNKLSFGKAAELLGIAKIQLITDLGKLGLPYFDYDISEILEDAKTAQKYSEEAH